MSEAVILRASITEPQPVNVVLSDSTYAALGLPNTVTFDDVLVGLHYKSGDYATIICKVINPDGTPAVGSSIRMVDAGGTNIVYTTDNAGKVIFTTNAGSANIIDEHGYFDLYSDTKVVDCPVGYMNYVELQRNTYGNGYNMPVITSSRTIKFSNYLNTVDVTVIGGGGKGGATGYSSKIDSKTRNGTWQITAGGGGAGTRGAINTKTAFAVTPGDCSVIIGGGSSTGNTTSDSDGIYRASRDRSSMSVWGQISGNGASGGTSSFAGSISATGGVGGQNSTGSNVGNNNSYTNRTTGYGRGDGGYCSWGQPVYYKTTYKKGTDSDGDRTYTRTITAYVYAYGGSAGAVYVNNLQYKI